jgi:hypothetical protein
MILRVLFEEHAQRAPARMRARAQQARSGARACCA